MSRIARSLLTTVTCGVLTAAATAAWPTDPAQNLPVYTGTAGQLTPLVAASPDGSTWYGWFNPASGNLDLYVQNVDADGNLIFGPGGLLVSSHPQNTALFGWDLTVDSTGRAIIVFSDERDGGDLDIHAYRICPCGAFFWGVNGITLSSNADFEPAPRVTEASNGDLVFVWARLPDAGDGELLMQRVTQAGQVLLAAGGVSIASAPGEDPAFADVVPSDNGSVIVSWVRSISTFLSPRHVRSQKFDANADPLWGTAPLDIFDAASIAIASYPVLIPDGAGGAVHAWYWPSGQLFESAVQHITAAGAEVFAHNGITVTGAGTLGALSPSIVYDGASQSVLAFWQAKNANQTMWGVSGQRINAAGQRLWGETGDVLLPLDDIEKTFVRAVPASDGAMVFCFDKPTGSVIDARIVGLRVDGDGNLVWPGTPVVVSSVLSGKDDLEVVLDTAGGAVAGWQDQRNDGGDVYAQRVNPDGTLGPPPVPGDVDGDGIVDVDDLTLVILGWGPCPDPPDPCPADLDGDGVVEVDDLTEVILGWSLP